MDATPNPEAKFLARVTAGTTHEFRNVLAIIKESAGLVSDLIAIAEPPATPDPARLLRAVERVDAQVARGVALLTALNGLSHSLDDPLCVIDLTRVVDQVVVLAGRIARLKQRRLEAGPCREPESVVAKTHSLRLQMALVAALECSLELVPEGGTVVLRPGRTGGAPSVQVAGAGGDPWAAPSGAPSGAPFDHGDVLRGLLLDLGASVVPIEDGGGFAIVLSEQVGETL